LKKIIYLFLICIFASAAIGQDKKNAKIQSNVVEDISNQPLTSKKIPVSVNFRGEPSNTIPGSIGYWDYITNGSNLNNIAVYGDTIIVCYPWASQGNPTGAESRTNYYLVSFDAGVTWSEPLAVSTLPTLSAYPEIHTYFSDTRQLIISGRRYTPFPANLARGGAWKDAFFGLGSFNGANVQEDGRDFFGAALSGGIIGGLSSFPNAPTGGTIDTLYFLKYNGATNSFSGRTKIADPGLNQIGGNVRYRLVADQTGNDVLAVWYKDTLTGFANTGLAFSKSSNGGTTWTTPAFIQKQGGINNVIGGDSVTAWFGIDAAYKPGSTEYGIVWSTLKANIATGQYFALNTSNKILFQSPTINGGVPTIIAGEENMNIMSDTALFNNTQGLQVGVLPVSHPSIAYSADGSRIFVAFSAFQPGDSAGGFTFNDIYYTWSDNGGLTWVPPVNLTNTADEDELYPTISMTGNSRTKFHVHYQSTSIPGSQSFSDPTPAVIVPVYQCYKGVDVPNSVNNISSTVPDKFSLKQNYPNPFNPTTSIRFDVTKSSRMSLNIYDASGKLVQTLINNEVVQTGTNEVMFDAGKLSSGVYFYTLSSDSFRETKKMMLVK
jgi:hypothetical protein